MLIQLKPDSLLAEADFGSSGRRGEDEGGNEKSTSNIHGYGAGSELTATITSLMQRTPALRHRHLAVSI